MCQNLKKYMVYDMVKCLFHFYATEFYFNGTNFDTTFSEFSLRFNPLSTNPTKWSTK